MTQNEANILFSKYDFATAKQMLLDECHLNGVEVDEVNASIFELMAAAVNGVGSVATKSTSSNPTILGGGNGPAPVGGGEPSSAAEPTGEPTEPSNPEPTAEPSLFPEPAEPTGEPQSSEPEPNNNGEPMTEPTEPQSEPQSNGKRTRNTPSWKKIAEQIAEQKDEEMKQKMAEMQKQIDDAKAQSSEPQSLEDIEKKAAELIRKAELIREEERKRKEEEAKRKAAAQSTSFHNKSKELVRRSIRLHNKGGVTFLAGPAGSGKTTLAIDACRILFDIKTRSDVLLSGKFAFISLTADTITANIVGMTDINNNYHESDIIRVFREGGVILFDEVDAADANIMAGLNAMVANASVMTPNGIITKHPDCHIIWAGNTWGTGATSQYTARNRLDAATLDRAVLGKIMIDYDAKLEKMMCESDGLPSSDIAWLMNTASKLRNVIIANKWKHLCSTRFVQQACTMMLDIGDERSPAYSHDEIVGIYLEDKNEHEQRIIKNALR